MFCILIGMLVIRVSILVQTQHLLFNQFVLYVAQGYVVRYIQVCNSTFLVECSFFYHFESFSLTIN